MPKFVIIPEKQNVFTEKLLFISSDLPLEEMSACLYKGSLHYNFKTEYETLPNIDKKLYELTFVITNGSSRFVGLKYDPSTDEAPIISIKGTDIARIEKYCAEKYLSIANDGCIAEKLFKCDSGEYIPEEYYLEVARIMVKMYNSNE